MRKTLFITSTFFLIEIFLFINESKAQIVNPKYNVLFIAIDDMNDRCSILRKPEQNIYEVKTPNLERLKAHGTVFKKAYCQFSLCSPSRTSLLTGWRPGTTKILDNNTRPRSILGQNIKFLPEYFKQYGYHIERYGKILHRPFENDIAWDYAEPPESSSESDRNAFDTSYPGGTWWIDDKSDANDLQLVSHLLQRIQQSQNGLQPFFYGLGLATHNPFTPALKYWNLNGDSADQELLPDVTGQKTTLKGNGSASIILPVTPLNDRSDIPSVALKTQIIKPDYEWKKTIHAYDAEVSQMDAQLGRVLDELDSLNLWQNTIVIFWSDHGQHLGEHEGLWLKQTLFEESLHVPLVICVPGIPGGTECSRLVELVDLYPTLAELCGLPSPLNMEGKSLAPLLKNPDIEWKKAIFSEVNRGRSVLTEQYRYTSWNRSEEELYDHIADPYEYNNLATNPAFATTLNEMKTILQQGWEEALPLQIYYRDYDGDGYGNLSDTIYARVAPGGYISTASDCNDSNASIYPYAAEICNNGIDDNCNGEIDEGVQSVFYQDADGDGFGNPLNFVNACSMPAGYVNENTDCNDTISSIHPGAVEICNGIDDNCNGQVDENVITSIISPSGTIATCNGAFVLLEANANNGIMYQWLKNETPITNATKKTYTVKVSGDYQVIEKTNMGCISTSPVTKINVYNNPPATIKIASGPDICATGSALLLANKNDNNYTYQWKNNGISIYGAVNVSYKATAIGSYTVIVTNINGCSKTSSPVNIISSCVRPATEKSALVSKQDVVYDSFFFNPNPSNGNIKVVYQSTRDGKIALQVCDFSTKILFSKNLSFIKGTNIYMLNLSHLPVGVYYMQIRNESSISKPKKIVISK